MVRVTRALAPLVMVGLFVAAAASGCGFSVSSFCETRESCLNGSEQDTEACEISYDVLLETADDLGCSCEAEEYFSCLEDNSTREAEPSGTCDTAEDCGMLPGASCVDNICIVKVYGLVDDSVCKTQESAFQRCINL